MVVATAAGFALLAVAWAWPLAPNLRSAYLATGADPSGLLRSDAMLTSWMLAWGTHALQTDPTTLFHANNLYPLPWTFALSENLLAGALLVFPVELVWHDPVLDNNVLVLATFALGGLGTTLLVRELGAEWPAAWLAGALVAFDPLRIATIGHVHALSTHWMPFALLAIHRCLRRGRGAVAVALGVLAVTLSSVYYAYFFLLALAVLLVAYAAFGGPAAPGGWRRVVAGIAAATVATAPVLVPYLVARDLYGLSHGSGEAWFFGGKGAMYLGALTDPLAYLQQRYVAGALVAPVLGPPTLVLALAGLAAGAPRGGRRAALPYLVMAIVLALVSLGPLMQWGGDFSLALPGPWMLLDHVVPGFSALRVPIRAGNVAVLGVAVLAGFGAQALWTRARGAGARAAVVALFLAIGVVESWRPAFSLLPAPSLATAPPVYRWLAERTEPGAVVELPIGSPLLDAMYQLRSTTHWRRIVNGVSGFTPTMSFFRGFLFQFPNGRTLRLLSDIGVRWVVVHPADMAEIQRGSLCDLAPLAAAPWAFVVHRDAESCVFQIHGGPPPKTWPDHIVPLDGATVTASDPDGVEAVLDGRLETHWAIEVDPRREAWLQLDLQEPHTIARIVLQLGSHFGDYMRLWRVETSLDGTTWTVAATESNGVPPLAAMRKDPTHLTQELRLPFVLARHVRIVQPGADSAPPSSDLWANWRRWGVHEIEIFDVPPRAAPPPEAPPD